MVVVVFCTQVLVLDLRKEHLLVERGEYVYGISKFLSRFSSQNIGFLIQTMNY